MFSADDQALAGAVFNTVSQFGSSIGLAIAGVIAGSTKGHSIHESNADPAALVAGYRAVFWTCFGAMVTASIIGAIGLYNVGIVGQRRGDNCDLNEERERKGAV